MTTGSLKSGIKPSFKTLQFWEIIKTLIIYVSENILTPNIQEMVYVIQWNGCPSVIGMQQIVRLF